MRTSARYLLVMLGILASVPVCAETASSQRAEQARKPVAAAKMTLAQAIENAQKESEGGLLVSAELLPDDVPPACLAKFLVAGKIKEVWIDGVDGRVQGSRTRDVVPERRDWVGELPAAVDKCGKSALEMLKMLTERPGGLTGVYRIGYERQRGRWFFVGLLSPKEQSEKDFTGQVCFRYELDGNWDPHDGASLSKTIHFDQERPGEVPSRWRIAQTHPTKAMAVWEIVSDPTAPSKPNVFSLTRSENVDGTYNLAILPLKIQNLDLVVEVKAVSGKEDQGGGLIWRCKDENNYYVCRLNPLENNFRVYVVKDGVRKQLQSADAQAVAGRWYPIEVQMSGKHIICYLDGKRMLEVDDETLPDAGGIGLWTKADAATSFDDLTFSNLNEELLAPSRPTMH